MFVDGDQRGDIHAALIASAVAQSQGVTVALADMLPRCSPEPEARCRGTVSSATMQGGTRVWQGVG